MVNFMELVEKTLSFSFGHYFSKVMFLHPLYGSINEEYRVLLVIHKSLCNALLLIQ